MRAHLGIVMESRQEHPAEVLRETYISEQHFDVALRTGATEVRANRLVLSLCSDFLREVIADYPPHIEPVIVLPEIREDLLPDFVRFVYTGELALAERDFPSFMEICNALKLKCVITTDVTEEEDQEDEDVQLVGEKASEEPAEDPLAASAPAGAKNTSYDEIVNSSLTIEVHDDHGEAVQYHVFETDEANIFDTTPESKPPKRTLPTSADANQPKKRKVKTEATTDEQEAINNAAEEVVRCESTFKRAAEKYGVSKTALWRRVHQLPPDRRVEYTGNRRNSEVTEMVAEALANGETLLSLSKRRGIPLSTLHRHKIRLFSEGQLPENVKIKQRTRGNDFDERLEMAINAVRNGISQSEAAKRYKIPKSTIWRRFRTVTVVKQEPCVGDEAETSPCITISTLLQGGGGGAGGSKGGDEGEKDL